MKYKIKFPAHCARCSLPRNHEGWHDWPNKGIPTRARHLLKELDDD